MECGASPIDTATPQENQRLETRHVAAKKRAFRARLPPILIFSTRYQTGWNVTKCHACHAKRHDNLLGHIRIGDVFHLPYRHGDATGKRATRDKTRGCRKTSISYETSGNFHSWQHDKRTGFAASPIDTAKPRENQRLETRHVGAPKRAFRARLAPIFTLCSFKIAVFLRVFLGTSKFCNLKIDVSCKASVNFQHIVTKCHACHGICTLSPLDAALPMRFAKNTLHETSKVLRLPRKMTMVTSKVLRLPRKLPRIF